MAKFVVTGTAGSSKDRRPFEKVVEAQSEKMAREYVMALFGSNAGIKRSAIKIESVGKA